jgi:hypothetical protein
MVRGNNTMIQGGSPDQVCYLLEILIPGYKIIQKTNIWNIIKPAKCF